MAKGIYKHKPHSEERKQKISQANIGKHEHLTGRKLTEKTKLKMSEAHKGEKAYQWKGGISKHYKTGYYSREYRQWRITIFERDHYQCQGCTQVGGYLTAHHIKSFAKYPKLRFDINNGITLCEDCHKLTDNYKGRAKKI